MFKSLVSATKINIFDDLLEAFVQTLDLVHKLVLNPFYVAIGRTVILVASNGVIAAIAEVMKVTKYHVKVAYLRPPTTTGGVAVTYAFKGRMSDYAF